jgi:hypothetical protein
MPRYVTPRAIDGVDDEVRAPVDLRPIDRRVRGDDHDGIRPVEEVRKVRAVSDYARTVTERGHVWVMESNVRTALGDAGQDVRRR